jgi:hypothetical protein
MITIVKLGSENKKQIFKYFFVNGTIKLWYQLPAEELAIITVNHTFLKRVRKVTVSEQK